MANRLQQFISFGQHEIQLLTSRTREHEVCNYACSKLTTCLCRCLH